MHAVLMTNRVAWAPSAAIALSLAGQGALAVLTACGPKVAPLPVAFDEDLAPRRVADVPPEDPMLAAERPVAPAGAGARTGTIARDQLLAVLDAGPGAFLRQLEVAPRMSGERFVGWELVGLVDRASPLRGVDVAPGDVLLSVNEQALSRPDQLQLLWDSLRGADGVTAQLWRGDAKLTLAFAIEPAPPKPAQP